jgi:hypothetical protein
MNQKSMVHLVFIVILAGWHNLLVTVRIAIGKLDLHAGPDEQDQQPLGNAVLLNTYVKSKKLAWENPAAASAYTSRSVIVLSPAITPSAPQYYLGKKTTFSMTKQRAIRLQTGGGSRFLLNRAPKISTINQRHLSPRQHLISAVASPNAEVIGTAISVTVPPTLSDSSVAQSDG